MLKEEEKNSKIVCLHEATDPLTLFMKETFPFIFSAKTKFSDMKQESCEIKFNLPPNIKRGNNDI